MTSGRLAVLCAALVLVVSELTAARAEDSADSILKDAERRQSTSQEYVGELTVRSRTGAVRRKTWVSYREGTGRSASHLIRFLSPADVRGVAFLSIGHPDAPPDQWMYLPSMKRERRIAPQEQDLSFVGTDFSYADLEEFDRTAYTSARLADETVDAELCYAIQLVPRGKSPYTKKLLVLSKSRLVPLRVRAFRGATVSKELSFADYRQIGDRWTAMRLEMVDVAKASRTTVVLSDVKFDQPQPRDRFTLQSLVREAMVRPTRPDSTPPVARAYEVIHALVAGPNGDRGASSSALPAGFSGALDTRLFLYGAGRTAADDRAVSWNRLDLRQQVERARIRAAVAVRAETIPDQSLGAPQWDPADRRPRSSPLSLRELSLGLTVLPAIDLSLGRFELSWDGNDTFSPAGGFLPRDLTDPFAAERLPLWGARLTGQRGRYRFDVYHAFTTTPWRLPEMDGRFSPFASSDVYLSDPAEAPPTRGFDSVRITRNGRGWDMTGWVRTGVRPAPLLSGDLATATAVQQGRVVEIARRFPVESATGVEGTHVVGSWVVRGELSVSRSSDPELGTTGVYTAEAEHHVRSGLLTLAWAGRSPRGPISPTVPFDLAVLPGIAIAVTQTEAWGDWRALWVATIDNAGGLFSAEVGKPLTDAWRITIGTDVPHGSSISALGAFGAARRLRTALQLRW